MTNTDETYACCDDLDLLRGIEALGRRGICKVKITQGEFTTRKMSRAYVSEAEEAEGVVLACRCYPRSDIDLVAVEKMAQCVERSLERAKAAAESATNS